MESLGYTIMYFIDKEATPWLTMERQEEILASKKNFIESSSCPPQFEMIKTFIKYCNQLGFTDAPDYEYLKKLIRTKNSPIQLFEEIGLKLMTKLSQEMIKQSFNQFIEEDLQQKSKEKEE